MEGENFEKVPGHVLFAKMGKKVLRPGGKNLTLKLVENMQFSRTDDVVEFGPGYGYTAKLCLKKKPRSYLGIDSDQNTIRQLKLLFTNPNTSFVSGAASNTNLLNTSVDKVYGEAMLTMHSANQKSKIISEAFRILKKGGLYGIHELALTAEDLNTDLKATIERELAAALRVNARPLSQEEWQNLLENHGFEILAIDTNEMNLLDPVRLIDDEGFIQFIKIAFNVLMNPTARTKILAIRKVFRKYKSNMSGITILARKL